MYQVLARKWRPKGFDELVGQEHVGRTLGNAIESDRLAHAYIFAGLRGTGKTSAARIFARCLNCERGPTATPCNECTPCREIAESQAIDVMEIDAASRTKVEQTRELLELVSYAPARDRYKILIIDEAHMLSKASFNALLKTLEEPPPNVVFVLATTELHQVLPTILSRCQVFEFRRVSPKQATAHLRRLCEAERIEISDVSLERIARAGEGSVRDSLSLLERMLALCGSSIEDDKVLEVLGAVRNEVLTTLVAAMAGRDGAAMLSVLDSLVDEGHDLVHFWKELIAVLRDLLLLRTMAGKTDLLARSADEAEDLARAAEGLTLEDLTRIFQIVADLEPGLKSSAQPRYLFEAALVRLAGLGAVRPIEELLAGLGPGSGSPGQPARGGERGRRGGADRGPAASKRAAPVPETGAPRAAVRAEDPAAPVAATPSADSGDPGSRIHAAVRSERPMLAAILDEASSIAVVDGSLRVSFAPTNEPLARQLQRKEHLETLRRCVREITGQQVRVAVETGEQAAPADPGPRNEPAPSGEPERPRTRPGRSELMKRATSDPGVKKLLHEFGAQVVDIRPLGSENLETE